MAEGAVRAVMVHISGRPDGSAEVALGDGASPLVRRTVPADQVRALANAVEMELHGEPDVFVPGVDAGRSEAEERIGRMLACWLDDPALGRRVGELQGAAAASGHRPVWLLDVEEGPLASLPWELLATSPESAPLEVASQGAVVRLTPGHGRVAAPGPLESWIWCPTRDDPTCARLLRHLCSLDDGTRMVPEGGLSWADTSTSSVRRILYLVCHGAQAAELVRMQVDGKDQGVGTAAHVLGPALASSVLAVALVCEGGARAVDAIDHLGGRLVASGAAACVAPAGAVTREACEAFASGVHQALRRGSAVDTAVAEGRRRVRSLADPDPRARWSVFRMWACSAEAATRCLGSHACDWPVGDELRAVLRDAAAFASRAGDVHVGLEHVAWATRESVGGGPVTLWLRRVLAGTPASRWTALRVGWALRRGAENSAAPTPRLASILSALDADADLEAFWRAAVSACPDALHAWLGERMMAPGAATLAESVTWTPDETPVARPSVSIVSRLEVVWGPEAGRSWQPAVGDVVGRASGKSVVACALFDGTPVVDRALHRHQLTWLGLGRVSLDYAAKLWRDGEDADVPAGELELRFGDVLKLTPGTWVRVLHE